MKSITAAADIDLLQEDLKLVYKWTSKNNMSLNGSKFEHLPYGKNHQVRSHSTYLPDTGDVIESKDAVKDLGVLLSNNLSYDIHLQNIVKKSKA